METDELYNRLSEVFRDVFDDDEIVISTETTAKDIDGWDSLRHVRLLLTIERVFGIKFSAYEVNKLKNVGHLAKLVQAKIAAQS